MIVARSEFQASYTFSFTLLCLWLPNNARDLKNKKKIFFYLNFSVFSNNWYTIETRVIDPFVLETELLFTIFSFKR